MPNNVKNTAYGFLAAGLCILALGIWGLYRDIGPIAQYFYAFAWWGYIFALDGYIALRRGHSLVTARREHFFRLFIGSITFWFFFELLNLRYQNWYYVGVSTNLLAGFLFGMLAFSTVLIGMFETYEALTASGVFKNWRSAPRKLPAWASWAVQGVGLAMVSLSLFFPLYLAPLVWGSLSFLVDPWNYRKGARSILHDIENGDWGLVARIFVGGAICGLFWESMNFFVPQKWIYTVRGLEEFKLFEMPLLGFLGFPALALDGIAFYSLVSYWFLGNTTWEHEADLSYSLEGRPKLSAAGKAGLVLLQVLFWGVVLLGVREVNTASVVLNLRGLPSLPADGLVKLEGKGIHRPIQLLRSCRDPETRRRYEALLGCDDSEFQNILDEAELFSFKGIGTHHGRLLQETGVNSVRDLGEWDPEELHSAIATTAERLGVADKLPRPPRLDIVRVWVLAARSRSILQRAG
jgi:hypothetical protein